MTTAVTIEVLSKLPIISVDELRLIHAKLTQMIQDHSVYRPLALNRHLSAGDIVQFNHGGIHFIKIEKINGPGLQGLEVDVETLNIKADAVLWMVDTSQVTRVARGQ